jgi:hypothetical protein
MTVMQQRAALSTIQPVCCKRERSRSTVREEKMDKPGTDFPDAVIRCDSVRDFLNPECERFKGMAVVRSPKWDHVQHIFDQLHDYGVFGDEENVNKIIPLVSERPASVQIDATIRYLLSPLTRLGLPADLAAQIQQDAVEMGSVLAELLPEAAKLVVRLELLRDNICARWHQDNYVARAIVSYNCSATQYVHDDFVDFQIFDNVEREREAICQGKVRVVRDRKAICSAGVGSILLMKGKLFPSHVNGLVHKAPEKFYRKDGSIATRLLLKVDVPEASFTGK